MRNNLNRRQDEVFLLAKNQTLEARLTEHGIHYKFQITDGRHAWPVCRGYLAAFVPLIVLH